MNRIFDLSFTVCDPALFLKAAAERLVVQNAYETIEDATAALAENIDEAARVLLDPGQLPGAEILDSSCSVEQ